MRRLQFSIRPCDPSWHDSLESELPSIIGRHPAKSIERGVEWFLLTRAGNGDITFRIEARWMRGEFPNWWSRLGFVVLAGYYQRRWHRHAHQRMALLSYYGSPRRPRGDAAGLTHQGVDVTFTYHPKQKRFI